MVVIGVVAPQADTPPVVAVYEAGQKAGRTNAPATADGHLELLGWSRSWPGTHLGRSRLRNLTRR